MEQTCELPLSWNSIHREKYCVFSNEPSSVIFFLKNTSTLSQILVCYLTDFTVVDNLNFLVPCY